MTKTVSAWQAQPILSVYVFSQFCPNLGWRHNKILSDNPWYIIPNTHPHLQQLKKIIWTGPCYKCVLPLLQTMQWAMKSSHWNSVVITWQSGCHYYEWFRSNDLTCLWARLCYSITQSVSPLAHSISAQLTENWESKMWYQVYSYFFF